MPRNIPRARTIAHSRLKPNLTPDLTYFGPTYWTPFEMGDGLMVWTGEAWYYDGSDTGGTSTFGFWSTAGWTVGFRPTQMHLTIVTEETMAANRSCVLELYDPDTYPIVEDQNITSPRGGAGTYNFTYGTDFSQNKDIDQLQFWMGQSATTPPFTVPFYITAINFT